MKILITLSYLICSLSFAGMNACIMEDYASEVKDTGSSLKEISQNALIIGSCKKYRKERRKRKRNRGKLSDKAFNRIKVLCGKDIFLNLGMRTNIGIPVKLLQSIEQYPEVGKKLKNLGLLTDESWEKKRWPFGIVKAKHKNVLAAKRLTTNKIVQISCAACHTGELPDGRFSIGMTNEKFKYGEFNQYTLFSIWMVDKGKYNPKRWLPELIEKYKNLRSQNKSKFIKMIERQKSCL